MGTMLGLLSDFGLWNTVDNIKANPTIFADQYAWNIVSTGWVSVVALIGSAAIIGNELFCHFSKRNEPNKPEAGDG